MVRKYGGTIQRGKKISKMKIDEITKRLEIYKEFKDSKYYQHLQAKHKSYT